MNGATASRATPIRNFFFFASILFLSALAIPETRPEDVGLSSERLARLHRYVAGEVSSGRIAGAVTLVARRSQVSYLDCAGMADVEASSPMTPESIFRLRSMTKPIVSLAVLMLYEEGRFLLDDPVSKFIPELAHRKVASVDEATGKVKTVPAEREITILDLLTHRSGLTYAFLSQGPILDLYREARLDEAPTNEELVHRIATLPLVHQPGTEFQYSRSTDVLGRFVEIVSGESLDRLLSERILGPLGMKDTSFYLSEEKAPRLVTLYERVDGGGLRPLETFRESPKVKGPKTLFEGGGGLVGDVSDYYRFLQMLLNGGVLDGVRLVSPKTVELMTTDLVGQEIGIHPGYGFGLGVAVRQALGRGHVIGSEGEYTWGGIDNTVFWVDPKEELILVFMTNFQPYDLTQRWYVKTLVDQAIVAVR
jgi:CubicO group peptidase (beta-lactamase class C family)